MGSALQIETMNMRAIKKYNNKNGGGEDVYSNELINHALHFSFYIDITHIDGIYYVVTAGASDKQGRY